MILATAVVLVLFVIYDKYSEGFTNENSPRPPVTSCPQLGERGGIVTAYYDKKDVMCCDGKVTNNKCDSKPICTLGKAKGDIKSCADVMAKQYEDIGKFFCPAKLPNFFLDFDKGISGCTDAPLKANYKGPVRDSANKCNTYITKDNLESRDWAEKAMNEQDGCLLQKQLENLQKDCIGQDCIPFARKVPSQNITLTGFDFTDVDNVRRTCYENWSYDSYIRKINTNANAYMSPYKEQICSNAKKLYIDKAKL